MAGGGGNYLREAIILNISVKGGRLFEGDDQSRDGYYSRKYGILAINRSKCTNQLFLVFTANNMAV